MKTPGEVLQKDRTIGSIAQCHQDAATQGKSFAADFEVNNF